jgi:hypothetical protein
LGLRGFNLGTVIRRLQVSKTAMGNLSERFKEPVVLDLPKVVKVAWARTLPKTWEISY